MAGDPSGCRQALAAVPQAAPGAGGILVDQPRVLARARPFLERHGSPTVARCTPGTCSPPTGGRPVPAGQRAARLGRRPRGPRILTALARGATSDTRLRIFEMLLPTDTTPHRAKLSDVLMLLLFDGARERTLGQYRDLLEGTGWRLERVVASPDR
jgi:hypothetical protein